MMTPKACDCLKTIRGFVDGLQVFSVRRAIHHKSTTRGAGAFRLPGIIVVSRLIKAKRSSIILADSGNPLQRPGCGGFQAA